MIHDMPRHRPPYLHREVTRHGRVVWYVRIGTGPRVRIKADYGTPAFQAAYKAAVAGEPLPGERKPGQGTLAWLWLRYRETADWAGLASATRKQRENVMRHVLKDAATVPFAAITKAHIRAGVDRRRETPGQARHFLQAMSGLFRWAAEADLVAVNPCDGVRVKLKRGDGFPVWTLDECRAYAARWPIGTRERLAFDVLFWTGLRRGDAARLGRQHIRDGMVRMKAEKTGAALHIPVLPPLTASIEAVEPKGLALIATADGRAMTKESFGNFFREACRAAGVEKSAHGLRKALATLVAERGGSERQLDALFGWSADGMAAHYTRSAERAEMARQAAALLAGFRLETGTPIPAPCNPVRATGKKDE